MNPVLWFDWYISWEDIVKANIFFTDLLIVLADIRPYQCVDDLFKMWLKEGCRAALQHSSQDHERGPGVRGRVGRGHMIQH